MVRTKEKKRLDKTPGDALGLAQVPETLTRQLSENNGGIKIDQDVWDEFILVSKFLCLVREDPDVYDLFIWVREELNGCRPFSDSMVERIDQEIERELGPWT